MSPTGKTLFPCPEAPSSPAACFLPPTRSWTPSLQSCTLDGEALAERGGVCGTALPVVEAPKTQRSRQASLSTKLSFTDKRVPRLAAAVRSERFEALIAIAIVANCATMGLEAEQLLGRAGAAKPLVRFSEHAFTAIFFVELVLRCLVFGWRSITPLRRWGGCPSNCLDATLVLTTGVFMVWMLPLLGASDGGLLQTLTVLRAFRLVRLVRVVQRVEAFREVWLLLRGLSKSGSVLFWTVSVIFCITYIFAIFGVALIGVKLQAIQEDAVASQGYAGEELDALVEVTSGVMVVMFTLIQVLTLDSWTSIARPMMRYVPWSWMFFYLYIAVAVIVMMNLVTALIVENALKNSQQDEVELLTQREKDKRFGLSRLHNLFEMMDADGNKELNLQEFESAFDDDELCSKLKLHGIEREKCREVFTLLDSGDGVISMEEFFEGISKMDGPAQAADLFRNTKLNELLVKLMLQQNHELQEDLQEILRNTPGAVLAERPGSLRRRACRSPAKDLFMTHLSDKSGSAAPSPYQLSSPTSPPFNACLDDRQLPAKVSSPNWGDVSRASSANATDGELLARLTVAVEACNERLAALAAEVAELRPALGPALSPKSSDAAGCPTLPAAPALAESDVPRRSAWREAARARGASPGSQTAEAGGWRSGQLPVQETSASVQPPLARKTASSRSR